MVCLFAWRDHTAHFEKLLEMLASLLSIVVTCGHVKTFQNRLDAFRREDAPESRRRPARGAAAGVRPADGGAVGKAAHRPAAANQPIRVALDDDGAGGRVRARGVAPAGQSPGRGAVALAGAD